MRVSSRSQPPGCDQIPTGTHRPCVAQWLERPLGVREGAGFDPRPRHTKDVRNNGRFARLSLALGINELGNRLGASESV